MYVCVCNAVTDSQVLRAAEAGVRSLRSLQAHLGIALECGRCAGYAQGLLRGDTQTKNPRCNKDCGHCPRSKEKQK
ncbi:MAG: (2Fe-2S)-binding protein [Rhodocyclales bacterium]|nr:(2Fe-2S)-binding protein [Rhodocyclales bacterium]